MLEVGFGIWIFILSHEDMNFYVSYNPTLYMFVLFVLSSLFYVSVLSSYVCKLVLCFIQKLIVPGLEIEFGYYFSGTKKLLKNIKCVSKSIIMAPHWPRVWRRIPEKYQTLPIVSHVVAQFVLIDTSSLSLLSLASLRANHLPFH